MGSLNKLIIHLENSGRDLVFYSKSLDGANDLKDFLESHSAVSVEVEENNGYIVICV